MANKRIEMINLRHLLRLKLQGLSNRKIALSLGISRPTIDNYVKIFKSSGHSYEALSSMSDSELRAVLPVVEKKTDDRYRVLSSKLSYYAKEFKRPGGTFLNLWEEYRREHHPFYSYTQFRHHLSKYLGRSQGSLRHDHKYGDKLFVDYCGKKLHLTDRITGELIEVEVYVAILGASQYIYVEASSSQQLGDFIECTANALAYYGGVAQAIVPDNLKSAVHKADNYEPWINRNFQAFGLHYQTTILPARAYKPKDKPLVEGAVSMVYNHIFFPLRNQTFFSLADLNQAIGVELEKLNNRHFQDVDYSRQDLFLQYEQALLGPLPESTYELRVFRRAKVRPDYHVRFTEDKHFYSVPFEYKDKRVLIQATHTTVELYYQDQRIAWHARNRTAGGRSTKKEHLPPQYQFVHSWSREFFLKQATKIGSHTQAYFQGIFEVKTHVEQAYKSCLGIMDLAKVYPARRIEQACQRAAFYDNYAYQTIRNILEKGLDQLEWLGQADTDQGSILGQSHPNIRGSQYFK